LKVDPVSDEANIVPWFPMLHITNVH